MSDPDENTTGIEEARAALAESKKSAQTAEILVMNMGQVLDIVRARREVNHFAVEWRAIIQGRKQ